MIVLYKEFGKYCITEAENYNAIIRDGNKVTKFNICNSAKEAIDTIVNYGIASEEEVINETGEEI